MAEVVRPFLVTAMAHLMAVSALIGMTGREATDPAEIRQAFEQDRDNAGMTKQEGAANGR